jgi:hypothetical protein
MEEACPLAEENAVSSNRGLVAQIAEKVGAEKAQRIFRAMAQQHDPVKLAQILQRVPDVAPLPGDELPDG